MNNYKKIILDNGIPLYLNTNKNLKQVYFGYLVGYGSSGKWFHFNLDGKEYHVLPGCAHYLEHLLGERSKNGNIYTNIARNDNSINAYTDQYHTCYHMLGVNNIKESIKEIIEAIEDPVFSSEDVKKSRPAIEEEASMSTDHYNIIATNLALNNFYQYDSFYKTLTSIGNRATTKKIDCDTLRVCYDAFYNDNNKKIVISGNVDEKEIVDFLNDLFSRLPKHNSNVEVLNKNSDGIRKEYDEINRNVKREIGAIGFKVKKPDGLTKEELNFVLDIIVEYLHGSESKFSIDLERNRLIDVIKYNFFRWNEDYFEFIHSFISEKSKEYYETIVNEINKKDITKEDYEMLKKVLISLQVRALDDKYYSPENFGARIPYTENYSDIDFYTSVDYDKFKDMLEQIDFNNHTRVAVKKLIK